MKYPKNATDFKSQIAQLKARGLTIADVPPPSEHYMLYVHLCCMKYLLDSINPDNNFGRKLASLLSKYPNIDPNMLR
jgi:abortive infection bacteriophage resistance protein